MSIFDCVIIGAGPAGITASIYLKRANKNIILLEKSSPGGQVVKTNIVENYPGFSKIDGPTLATNMINQAINMGVDYQYGNVLKVIKEDDNYKVITDKDSYITKTVIVATGRSPKTLGLKDEDKLLGHGVSYCATCDGYLYKDKDVAVVGAGNSSFEESLYLSKMCNHVYVINRSENIRADEELQSRFFNSPNMELIKNSNVTSLESVDGKLTSITLNDSRKLKVDGLFVFIGQVPTKFLIDHLDMDGDYIVVDKNMATSLPGIYACGDIIKKDYYQISIAVGEGAIAGLNIIKMLKNK